MNLICDRHGSVSPGCTICAAEKKQIAILATKLELRDILLAQTILLFLLRPLCLTCEKKVQRRGGLNFEFLEVMVSQVIDYNLRTELLERINEAKAKEAKND